MVLDTETANTIQDGDSLDMSNVLVYDCGWAVVDTKGNIYETASYVNRDIFCEERDLMRTAYYNWKSPAMSRNCGQVAGNGNYLRNPQGYAGHYREVGH